MTIAVTLNEISNNGPKQKAIALQACKLAEEAINNSGFRETIESMSYRETRFRDSTGQSISVAVNEIYSYLESGQERGTSNDSEIDIQVKLKKFRRGVLGSTAPGKLPFFTSFWFINKCIANNDPISLASHFIHEWLHVSGFYHHPNNKARKDVAYNVGNAVRTILLGSTVDAKSNVANPDSAAYDLEFSECGGGHNETPEEFSEEEKAQLIQ